MSKHSLGWLKLRWNVEPVAANADPTDTELLDTAEREGWQIVTEIDGTTSVVFRYGVVRGPTLRAALTEAWRATRRVP